MAGGVSTNSGTNCASSGVLACSVSSRRRSVPRRWTARWAIGCSAMSATNHRGDVHDRDRSSQPAAEYRVGASGGVARPRTRTGTARVFGRGVRRGRCCVGVAASSASLPCPQVRSRSLTSDCVERMFDHMNTATATATASATSEADLCVSSTQAGVPSVAADPTGGVGGRARVRHSGRRPPHLVLLAGEDAASYDTDLVRLPLEVIAAEAGPRRPADAAGQAHDDPGSGATPEGELRTAVRTAAAAMRHVRRLALDGGLGRGELGALIELLPALDAGHAAAVGLAERIESQDLAPRRTGLPLESLLAFQSRLTF